ncbi:MAG: hypothetical protein P857_666 [Candidatus Xenolissoclinum pacificiensis L6]|uniref:Transposase n=1 Tax=Candidatus Xenolissoclinum pacificiensis L6 TaxID=1401685 RepID=W2V161_9RICK|nr:MAG: hypothetical protein P857_666 [Candidatus Xenolissoclinum pacificiensis L6]
MKENCKRYGSKKSIKNVLARDKQRYKCKVCKYYYIEGDARTKYSGSDRLKVIKLYLENCGIRTIERFTGIHNILISIWIEKTSRANQVRPRKSQK